MRSNAVRQGRGDDDGAEGISSILVRAEDVLGIVTDRDLRMKVVAEGIVPPCPSPG